VLLSRGPDAVLAKGSTIEMVLDRPLTFTESELNFTTGYQAPRVSTDGPGPEGQKTGSNATHRRFPF